MKINVHFKLCSILLAVFAVFLLSVSITNAQTKTKSDKQKKNTIVLKSQKTDSTRGGDDPNITQYETPNNNKDIPMSKDGTPRGKKATDCKITVENFTEWTIKVYIDGVYRATIAPWDDAELNYSPEELNIYIKAEMTDGSSVFWGPKTINCSMHVNRVRITP